MTKSNKEKVYKLLSEVFEVSIDQITDELAIGDIPEWDSLAHIRMIVALESELGITLDIEQTLEIEDVEDIVDAVANY